VIHPQHKECAMAALRAGKAVLCEKALALNAEDAREMMDLAVQKNLFFMEGMWSRYFPAIAKVRDLVSTKAIGDITSVLASFVFSDKGTPRITQPELGGGALLDIGVYPIALSSMIFGGAKPLEIKASGHLLPSNVDAQIGITLKYAKNGLAVLMCSVCAEGPNDAVIQGTKGYIKIHSPFWCPTNITVSIDGQTTTLDFPLPEVPKGRSYNFRNGTGMVYEIQYVHKALREGRKHSEFQSLEESQLIMEIMDEVRRQVGFKYPGEK